MGTPDFAARILFSLIEAGEDIVGVVTQADKPQGRGYVLTPSPVKKLATEHGLPVFQPDTLKDGAFEKTLHELTPDLIIVAAYGKILPPYIINYPPLGCINAHASFCLNIAGCAYTARYHGGRDRNRHHCNVYGRGLDTGDMILQHKCQSHRGSLRSCPRQMLAKRRRRHALPLIKKATRRGHLKTTARQRMRLK